MDTMRLPNLTYGIYDIVNVHLYNKVVDIYLSYRLFIMRVRVALSFTFIAILTILFIPLVDEDIDHVTQSQPDR